MNEGIKIARSAVIFAAVVCLAIFLPAGTFAYWQAWLMLAVYAICGAVMVSYLRATDPAALQRRERSPLEEQSPAQQRIVVLLIVVFFAVFPIAGLDHRLGWSMAPPIVALIGNALLVTAFALFAVVLRVNQWAATNIVVEAGQRVVTAGPYAIVRHPMYSGVLLMVLGIALGLGSYCAALLVLPTAAILGLRLLDEERFLVKNLPGYADYVRRMRWRLVPGVF